MADFVITSFKTDVRQKITRLTFSHVFKVKTKRLGIPQVRVSPVIVQGMQRSTAFIESNRTYSFSLTLPRGAGGVGSPKRTSINEGLDRFRSRTMVVRELEESMLV